MRYRFDQVDVFASSAFSGNPLAVVHDAEAAEDALLHRVTGWTNLSEVAFLLPPTDPRADYRVRIFCPGRELPFAGHPTLGAAAAWLAAGGTPGRDDGLVQQCGAGLVRVRRVVDRLAFAAPPTVRFGTVDAETLDDRLHTLGIDRDEVVDASWIDNGPGWLGILLDSAERVRSIELPSGAHRGFDVGLVAPFAATPSAEHLEQPAIEVRAFFADALGQVREDPVTGSLNASVAQWLIGTERVPDSYVAVQGTQLGHSGRVFVERLGADIWVGGEVHHRITGTIELG